MCNSSTRRSNYARLVNSGPLSLRIRCGEHARRTTIQARLYDPEEDMDKLVSWMSVDWITVPVVRRAK